MNKKRKFLIFITILTFFYGIYYWGIPAFINIEKRIAFIETQIQQRTGMKVSIKDPYVKMGHTPAVWFMAENISVVNDDNSKVVDLEHSSVKIHLLPLLLGKVQIGNFSSDKFDVNLLYTKDNELKLGQYSFPKLPKTRMTLSKAYIRIGNYKINLEDQKQNKQINLNGSYFTLDEFKKNKRVKLSTNAVLMVNKKMSEIMADIDIKLPINKITEDQFKINGRVTKLNLSDFSDYVRAISDGKISSISGIVNLIAETTTNLDMHKKIFAKLSIADLGIMQNEIPKSIYCDDNITFTTEIDTQKNGLNIKDLTVLSDGINLVINGNIKNLDSKIPYIESNIAIKNSKTEKFIQLLPGEKDLLEEVDFYALKKYPLYGDIDGELFINGLINSPDIIGKVDVNNAYLVKPLPYKTPKAAIKLDFNNSKMFLNAKVPAPFNQMVLVLGSQDLYGGKLADLTIKSTPNIDLKVAQIVLNPLHEILKFDIGPVPIMDINGSGDVDLHVTGTRKNPHAWGRLNFKNTTASFVDIHNLILKKGNGVLKFDDENTYFSTTSAFLNEKPISIDGECTLKGILDFNIVAKQQDLGEMLKVINNSSMLNSLQKLVAPITYAKGKSDFILNITGDVKDINKIIFNENIFAKGTIELFSNVIALNKIPLTDVNGKVVFNNLEANLDLASNLENSGIKIEGKLDEKNANLKIFSNKFVLKDGIKLMNLHIPYKEDIGKIHTSFVASYNGAIEKITTSGLNVKGKIYQSKGPDISIDNAVFEVNNGYLKNTNLKGLYKSSPFNINLNGYNILSEDQSINGDFNFQKLNLVNVKEIMSYLGLKNISEMTGVINLVGRIKNNDIYADAGINDITFTYLPENLKVKVSSGRVKLKKDILILEKINSRFSEMPVFADGKIYNIDKRPTFNLYVNAKPTQEFADLFINNKAVYPIKLKGDINLSSVISGTLEALRNKTQLKLAENASIYYMGATLGSTHDNQSSLLSIDNVIYPNGININNFQYDNLIPSQNNVMHRSPQLTASGSIDFLKDNDIKLKNFKIKTQTPTDAKIFNIIFRKPFMKQGIFTSDIVLNGTASAPRILGKLNITSIDIPLFDAVINDIDFDFKKDKIYLNSKGIVLTNNLNISAIIENNPKLPLIFEDIKINLESLDLNKITETLRDYDVNSSRNQATTPLQSLPDLSQIVIKNSEVVAGNIKIKELDAQDFLAHVTLNDKMQFEVQDFKFNMAEGTVNGNIKYNLLNNLVNLSMFVTKTNAQIIAETLFDLKGQIFGLVTGNINLYCNGKSQNSCTQTLAGDGSFIVTNGKMPKLGSLEYLLKAGNLVKGGITGLSINGIIDLITPHKTGDFESIKGEFHIADGIAEDIQIYSDGKDLNMYMKGSYNFTNLIADMQIFGALSKNFSTLFGKIGNASLNTLFNTIPGINISEAPSILTDEVKKIPNSEDAARMFTAEIYGDINGNDYVKSFKWLK